MRSNPQGMALAEDCAEPPVSARLAVKPMTRNERRVYDELRASATPMKAYALLENLYDDGIKAPMTVYRALDSLIERGVVKKITSLNAYAAVQDEGAHSIGAFVTCRRCGQTRKVSLSEELILRLLSPAGIAVGDVFIEAYGDCRKRDCRAATVQS